MNCYIPWKKFFSKICYEVKVWDFSTKSAKTFWAFAEIDIFLSNKARKHQYRMCMYICISLWIPKDIHSHTHTHIYIYIYIYTYTHIYIYIYIYTHTHTHIYIYIIYIYIHIHTHTHIYIYIYIYEDLNKFPDFYFYW